MTKKNIFTTGGNRNFIIETFKKVVKKKDFNLKAALVDNYDVNLKSIFNCTQVIEKNLYKLNTFINNHDNHLYEFDLDSDFMLDANLYFDLFASSFDRVQPMPNSNNFIKKIYLYQLNYFKNLIFNNKINKIFFLNTPHYPSQLSLYIVSKLLNIQIIIQQRSDIGSLYFLRSDLFNFDDAYKVDPKFINFKQRIKDYFKNNNIQSIYISAGKEKNKLVFKYYNSFLGKIILTFLNLFKVFYIDIILKMIGIKRNDINYSSLWANSPIHPIKVFFLKIKRIFSIILHYNYLSSIECTPDYDSDFILFALHFQPERSTHPEGGIFNDQILAIKLLSKNIPKNYKIYVKEHPRQLDFYPQLSKLHFRSRDYYKEINNLPNVYFIPIFSNLNQIIEKAKFISTITGSVAVDAIKKNIPSIVFSNTWYSKHKLVYVCQNSEDIKKIFSENNKKILNKNTIHDFINDISEILFLSSDGVIDVNSDTIDELSQSLSDRIINIFVSK